MVTGPGRTVGVAHPDRAGQQLRPGHMTTAGVGVDDIEDVLLSVLEDAGRQIGTV